MNFVERITKSQWTKLVLFACYCRMIGAAVFGLILKSGMDHGEIDPYIPLSIEPILFVPSAMYEVIALIALKHLTKEHSWKIAQQFNFFIGFATLNLVEEIFFRPNEFDISEYFGIPVGLSFILISYLWNRIKKNSVRGIS